LVLNKAAVIAGRPMTHKSRGSKTPRITQVDYTEEWADEHPGQANYVAGRSEWADRDWLSPGTFANFLAMHKEREWITTTRNLALRPGDVDRILLQPQVGKPLSAYAEKMLEVIRTLAVRNRIVSSPDDVMWRSPTSDYLGKARKRRRENPRYYKHSDREILRRVPDLSDSI
jgi:hypothetical protein